ncbi:thioredoxin domain-containing protein [Candidatus Kaiserbacteria bacterium]|nr:thioredoxin domain-containing protein [Candidatus Kaiserbacteria bacterium]
MESSPERAETGWRNTNLSIPVAIVVAGALIAGAVYFGNRGSGIADGTQPPAAEAGNLEEMRAISSDDHIRGNPDAPVKIIEYSDTECPFCKSFHPTMQRVMDEYGASGKAAWVYRHFPLDNIHPKADKEAEATECAAELGGNDAFWAYVDRLFEVTPSNNNLDPAELPKIAQYVGLDVANFNSCLSSGKYAAHVEEDYQNALSTGGNGTPWSIVIAKSGKKYPLSGAQPYEAVKQLLELALQEK